MDFTGTRVVYVNKKALIISLTLCCAEAPEYLLELMSDKNKAICKLCLKTLDIVAVSYIHQTHVPYRTIIIAGPYCNMHYINTNHLGCMPQEEKTELGQRIKSERFRWHNRNWLEMVTGEYLYEDEESEEDEDYLYFLHSAAELDNPDYFYGVPNSPSAMGEMIDHEGYLLSSAQQYYDDGVPMDGRFIHPAARFDVRIPLPRQNSPFASGFEGELEAGTGIDFNSPPPSNTTYKQDQMRRSNPLSSPGMLFSTGQDQDIEPQHYSASQLMPSMEDPLAMYRASFNTSVDLEQDFDYVDSEEKGLDFAPTSATTEYPGFVAANRRVGLGEQHGSVSEDDRIGF